MKFHYLCFSGKSLAAVTAIGYYAAIGRRCDRSAAAVAASSVVAALAVLPLDRFAVNQAATTPPVTTTTAGCPMDLPSSPNGGCSTAAAASAASRTKKIQALKTKGATAATAAARCAHDHGETVWGIPGPCEDSRFGDASWRCIPHRIPPIVLC